MRATSMLIVLSVGVLLAHGAIAGEQAQQDALKMLSEKARQREDLLDGVTATYSGKGSIAGNEIVTLKGSWAKDGARSRSDFQMSQQFMGIQRVYSFTQANDGQTTRRVHNQAGETYVEQSKGADYWTASRDYSPDCLAVTRLHMMPGRLSEILSGDTRGYTEKYKDDMPVEGGEFQVKLCGEESVGGRKCLVVEAGIRGGAGGQSGGCRMYFGQDVNYACVRIDAGEYKDGALNVEASVTMSDFREVKSGVFLAYAASLDATSPRTGVIMNGTYKVETLEFPTVFDANRFKLEIPLGAWVYDKTAKLWYKSGGEVGMEELSDLANDASEMPAVAESTESALLSTDSTQPSTDSIAVPAQTSALPSAQSQQAVASNDGHRLTAGLILIAFVAVVAGAFLATRRRKGPR